MHVIRSFFIALSLYSKIPVPQFVWNEEDMQYSLCFFPWVGAVIGLCLAGWYVLCERFSIGTLCYAAVGCAIPLVISGGFHVDGFMDTMDAFRSYQSRERKLEILKDSHIGAFSVICLALYYLLYLGAFSEVTVQRKSVGLRRGIFPGTIIQRTCCGDFSAGKKRRHALPVCRQCQPQSGYCGAGIAECPLRSVYVCTLTGDRSSRVCGSVVYIYLLPMAQLPRIWRDYRRYGRIFCDTL